ncbi:hypothetical protein N1F78_15260 [Seonamhaeicola sp. MEBiC1930]
MSLTTYKAIFSETKVAENEELQATEIQSKEEAIEELEEIDETEFEDIEL